MIGVRLQAGPFDGSRAPHPFLTSALPERIFVTSCGACSMGCRWYGEEVSGAEVYVRDECRDGWLIYVWTDEDLDSHIRFTNSVLALDGASS